jgi:hypothetical protein
MFGQEAEAETLSRETGNRRHGSGRSRELGGRQIPARFPLIGDSQSCNVPLFHIYIHF